MCVPNGPLFQRCQVYDYPPFFSKIGIWLTRFFFIRMWKPPTPFSDIPVYANIFAERFFKAACSPGIQWIHCYIFLTTSNKWPSIWRVFFFKRQVYEWGRSRNTGLQTRTTITPKLPPPPPPLCRAQSWWRVAGWGRGTGHTSWEDPDLHVRQGP